MAKVRFIFNFMCPRKFTISDEIFHPIRSQNEKMFLVNMKPIRFVQFSFISTGIHTRLFGNSFAKQLTPHQNNWLRFSRYYRKLKIYIIKTVSIASVEADQLYNLSNYSYYTHWHLLDLTYFLITSLYHSPYYIKSSYRNDVHRKF